MGKKGGSSSVQNYERPLSQQELALFATQNDMMQAGIGVAAEQEARSQEQHDYWKDNYLKMEGGGSGNTPQDALAMKKLDQQMPNYREDTSGVRDGSFNGYPGTAKGGV